MQLTEVKRQVIGDHASAKEIGALTGIRGIAALWVVIYHLQLGGSVFERVLKYFFTDAASKAQYFTQLMNNGYLSVDLFFVLSGFVMALSYKDFYKTGWTGAHYKEFMWRRIARVYPLYIIATLLAVAAIYIQGGTYLATEEVPALLPANLLGTQIWFGVKSINTPSWSICAEFAAYLIFPITTWLALSKRNWLGWLTSFACIGGLYWLQLSTQNMEKGGALDIAQYDSLKPVLRCVFEFTIGVFAYRAAQWSTAKHIFSSQFIGYIIAVLMVAMLAHTGFDLLIIGLVPLLVLHLYHCRKGVAAFFGSRIIVWLGHISFALYMFHYMLITPQRALRTALGDVLGNVAMLASVAVYLAVLLALSHLAYRLIERPAQKALNRLKLKLFPEKAVATA